VIILDPAAKKSHAKFLVSQLATAAICLFERSGRDLKQAGSILLRKIGLAHSEAVIRVNSLSRGSTAAGLRHE
jgi:hypothetical protein